jgi:hydroxymethylpyrimidine/phosphomethylpyrimidine kinase
MLFSTPVIRAISSVLGKLTKCPPLVIDPVMISSTGDPLLKAGAIASYKKHLFPLATLITPNLDELRVLTGQESRSLDEMRTAGKRLTAVTGAAVLLKGGHLKQEYATDILLQPDWNEHSYSSPFIRGIKTHGTGCTYSAAIAAGLAKGLPLHRAVGEAKKFVTRAISRSTKWGSVTALDQVQRHP